VAGAFLGGVANAIGPGSASLTWVLNYLARPAGQIFLNLLSMLVVPLVFTSLALGVAGMGDVRSLGRIGGRTIALIIPLAVVAAILGLVMVQVFKPGSVLSPETRAALLQRYAHEAAEQQAAGAKPFSVDVLTGIVPRNPVEAAAKGDILGLIVFTVLFGMGLTRLPPATAAPLLAGLGSLERVVAAMVDFVMHLAPWGVAGLVFDTTGRFGFGIFASLGAYVAVVLAGILILLLGVFPAFIQLVCRTSTVAFYRACWPAIVTAFATASSNATIPTTLQVAENGLGIPREVSSFVIPVGATLNKTGTAFFAAVAIVFLAQVFDVTLDGRTLVLVGVLSVAAAIAAGGIPFGVIPLLVGILAVAGIPAEGIALILGVDQLLGMARTVTNVVDDLVVALYVARAERLPPFAPAVERIQQRQVG
jgi:DAACS family dicarboxylate/amino acid:cation (Na+ or H+) symporter